ncbi:VOC family protein [Modestobacter excelsi]|uniref:VOC family protein n=1 Tax=Modestobacter excelsi TaxID=2213161 RepID=UPI001C20D8DF|nr:VOC family protein [Modestobacter excelsi]
MSAHDTGIPASSGARATPDDAATAGRNRIHLVVGDLDAEITRLRDAHLPLRSDVVTGPGGRQVLLADPDGNLVELFQAARRPGAAASPAPWTVGSRPRSRPAQGPARSRSASPASTHGTGCAER